MHFSISLLVKQERFRFAAWFGNEIHEALCPKNSTVLILLREGFASRVLHECSFQSMAPNTSMCSCFNYNRVHNVFML